MGGAESHIVELQPDQDSPTTPGCFSIISGSLDELNPPVTADEFLETLFKCLRRPVTDALMESVLKDVEVKEESPDSDCFTVKVILDGKKLPDGKDFCRRWKKVTFDRAQKLIITDDYVIDHIGQPVDEASDKDIKMQCHIKMLADPTRIECWLFQEGQRLHGEELSKGLYYWTDRVLSVFTMKIRVREGPSKKEPGFTSAISDPMDEDISYENFFQAMLKATRYVFTKFALPSHTVTAEDVNDGEILITTTDTASGDVVSKLTVKHSEDAGEMSLTWENAAGKVLGKSIRQLHKDPLVLEAWNINDKGERNVGPQFLYETQKSANDIITFANSTGYYVASFFGM